MWEKPLGAYGGKSLSDFELDDDLESEFDITFPPDLLNPDPTLDLDEEYFSTEQISSTYGSSGIRISYSDHSKVYVPKISEAYRSFLNLTDVTTLQDDGTGDKTSLYQDESLENVEEQFNRLANNLKRKIGITAWREFSSDFKEGWKKLQESETYSKLETKVSDITESIDEFKTLVKKDLTTIKEKATRELATVKDKASKEIATAKDKASKELATVSKEIQGLQKKASIVLKSTDPLEASSSSKSLQDQLPQPSTSKS